MASGFWSLFIMFLIMFYNSDLRMNLIVPTYDPEVNSDADIFELGIQTIHIDVPHQIVPNVMSNLRVYKPELFNKVKNNLMQGIQ